MPVLVLERYKMFTVIYESMQFVSFFKLYAPIYFVSGHGTVGESVSLMMFIGSNPAPDKDRRPS